MHRSSQLYSLVPEGELASKRTDDYRIPKDSCLAHVLDCLKLIGELTIRRRDEAEDISYLLLTWSFIKPGYAIPEGS